MLVIKKIHAQKYQVKGDKNERHAALKTLIYRHSKKVEGRFFSNKFRSGAWNGAVNVYSPTDIRIGYIKETIDHLNKNNVDWKWFEDKEPSNCPIKPDVRISKEEVTDFCEKYIEIIKKKYKDKNGVELETRDYQVDTVYELIKNYIGIVRHATGAGKSLTISLVIAYLFHKKLINRAIIIVPLQNLILQFKKDLVDFGFNEESIGCVYSKAKETDCQITIGLHKTLHNIADTEFGSEFFNSIDLIIQDECHTAAAKTGEAVIKNFFGGKYFFGFTGTLPEKEVEREKVFSLFGNIVDDISLKELEEDYDAVTPVIVGILEFDYGKKALLDKLSRTRSINDWYSEIDFLQNDDEFRNKYIIETTLKNVDKGKNSIVLVKTIEYGEKLYNWFKNETDKDVFCIFASGDEAKDVFEREKIIQKCRESKDNYIIVTNFKIFSTGLNIPNIGLVVFASSTKSDITVAQTIGRGVRKFTDKDKILILDVSSNLKYESLHCKKREKLYKREGFKLMKKTIRKEDICPKK